MKGIILANDRGEPLQPATNVVPVGLLPVCDKPAIYYALTALMQVTIKEILVITQPDDQGAFQVLLGNGSQWGIELFYTSSLEHMHAFLDGEPAVLIYAGDVDKCLHNMPLFDASKKPKFGIRTPEELHKAALFIEMLQAQFKILIGCPEDVALAKGWLDPEDVLARGEPKTEYERHVRGLALEFSLR
jgi:dTDP-glucose pyrophosphorylase